MSELSKKFSKLTGLNYDIDNLINNATTAEQKKVLYDKLMWDIKNGLIRGVDGIKELVQFVLPALAEALEQPSTAEVIDEPTVEYYTQEEAYAYNIGLNGSWVLGREATADDCNELNAGLNGILMYGAIKTPATYYTAEQAIEANAALEGALKSGVELTADQALAYNTVITGASKAEGNTLTAEEAALYNATLEGSKKENDQKTPDIPYENSEVTANNTPIEGAVKIGDVLTNEQVYAHNAKLPGAKKAGDPKPTQNNG